MPATPGPSYRFGLFELRSAPPALFREGQPVGVTPKALATLLALVSGGGEAVSKDDLLTTVWADTAVEEANLSQNIYTLRKLLAADFPDGNAIENIPRFGYRFTPPVRLVMPEEIVAAPEASALRAGPSEAPPPALPVEGTNAAEELRTQSEPDEGPIRAGRRPLTIAVAALLLLAFAVWQWPAVSSFASRPVQFEVTRFTSNLNEDRVTAVAISPDGKLVAYADADGVVLRGTEDSALHLLPSPKMRVVNQLAWFPDQLHLLLSGVSEATGAAEVWKVSVLREPPALFRENAQLATASHAGQSVALTTADGSELWVMGPNGEGSRRVASAGRGSRFSVVLWNLADDGILVQRRSVQPGNADATYSSLEGTATTTFEHVRLSDGAVTASQPNVLMGSACLTGDGNLIYSSVLGAAERESTLLREAAVNAKTGALGAPRDIFHVPSIDPHFHAFSCTASGDRIAVMRIQGAIGVFVGALNGSNTALSDVKRLSLDSDVAYAHGWTRDSKSVLYEAIRQQGKWQIFSQSLARHDPELIVAMNGSETRPVLTPDGKWVLFNYQQDKFGTRALYRVDPAGGMPSAVPGIVGAGNYRCPATRGQCVLLSDEGAEGAVFFAIDPVHGKGQQLFQVPQSLRKLIDWDLSPDGTTLVLNTTSGPNPLHTVLLKNGKVSDVPFHATSTVKSVNWAARGDGFFLANAAPYGESLSFLDLQGNLTQLRTTSTNTWAVPSPDGKFISFNDQDLDSNVWLLARK